MQFDWFLSVLEQKRLENHEIYYLHRSCWVTLEISTMRTSPRMEVPLLLTSFNNEFRILLLRKFKNCLARLLTHSWDRNHQKFVVYEIFFFTKFCFDSFFNDSVKPILRHILKSVIDSAVDCLEQFALILIKQKNP